MKVDVVAIASKSWESLLKIVPVGLKEVRQGTLKQHADIVIENAEGEDDHFNFFLVDYFLRETTEGPY